MGTQLNQLQTLIVGKIKMQTRESRARLLIHEEGFISTTISLRISQRIAPQTEPLSRERTSLLITTLFAIKFPPIIKIKVHSKRT